VDHANGNPINLTNVDLYPFYRFYRIVYKDHECLPAPEVLKKAKARVDKEGPAYCPVTNNCEHFANECKTGKKECHQKWTPIEIIGKSAISSIVSVKIAKPMSLMDKLRHLLARMLNIKPDLAEKYRANFNSKLAFFTAAKIEVFLLFRDCLDASTKFSEGNLTSKEFLEVVTERICAAGFSLGGFQLGYLLGGVTALAFPGWWPLSVLGAIVGGAGVDYVAKLLGGIAGQQIITPLVVYIAKEFLQSVKSTMSMVDLQKDLNVEKFLFSLESIINDLESETKKDV
ncbi:Hypothetical predicted protein, partial [Paramuricea clavata]